MSQKKGPLTETVSDAIIEYILENKMEPGDKLPNEMEFAQHLGVGRNTVREAIRRLAARNILVIRQGAGTFIADNTGMPEDPLGLTFIVSDEKLALELSEVRMLLEPSAAELAASNATPEQIQKMDELVEQIGEACKSEAPYHSYDIALHSLIAEASGNIILNKLLHIIAESAAVSIRVTQDRHRNVAYKEHKTIVDTIKRKDAIGARYAMLAHLNTTRQDLASKIDLSQG